MRISRLAWVAALALVALHVALVWHARTGAVFSDESLYVTLGRALRGFQYRELFRIDQPVHRMYPPGYPLLLAVASAVGGERPDWLVLVGIASSAGTLLLFFSVVARRWGAAAGLACLSAIAFNASLVLYSGLLFSEAPFILCSTIALWSLARDSDRARNAAVAGAAAIGAALIRSAGTSFVVALALYWLWQRRVRRAAVFAAVAAVTVGGWLTFTALAPSQVPGKSYLADAALRPAGTGVSHAIVNRARSNIAYGRILYSQIAPAVPGTVLDDLIVVPVVLAGLVAGLIAVAAEWPAAIVYMAAHGALVLVWPYTVQRFLVPLLPCLLMTVVVGVHVVATAVRRQWQMPALLVVVLILSSVGVRDTFDRIRARRGCDRTQAIPPRTCVDDVDQRWGDFFVAMQYVKNRVPPDATFAAVSPATLFYNTGHRTVPLTPALGASTAEFIPFLREHRAEYLLLAPVTAFFDAAPRGGLAFAEMIGANCQHFKIEASFAESTYVLSLRPSGDEPDSAATCAALDSYLTRYRRPRN